MARPLPIAYDTETTGLQPYGGDRMFAYSTCTVDGKTVVRRLDGPKLRRVRSRKALQRMWAPEQRRVPKVMHNAKFDLSFTAEELDDDTVVDHDWHCTSLQSRILQNHHPSHRLKALAWELAGVPRSDEAVVRKYVKSGYNYQEVPEHLMDEYQRQDGQRAMLLHLFFNPKILANSDFRRIYRMERDLVGVTMRMEKHGIMLNRSRCIKLIAKIRADLEQVKMDFRAFAKKETGEAFDASQVAKVANLLYKHMKLPVFAHTKSGGPSTDKDDALLPLRAAHYHPVLDLILQYRSWSRGVTMLESYLGFADTNDIIHPDIHTCAAVTGRESSSRPNLQNVEKIGVLKNPFPVPARLVFRPRPGYVNFHLDYSGIELRLLIHYANELEMVKEFRRQGGDCHGLAAGVFYPPFTEQEVREFDTVPPAIQVGFESYGLDEPMRKTLRDATKNCNFAIPYGAGVPTASSTLNLPTALGAKRYYAYQRRFPRLCGLNKAIAGQVRGSGQVVTVFGRVLNVPRNKAYVGLNYLIQGTAAGVMKRAQIRIEKYLLEATGGEMRLVPPPVHDEAIIECPRTRLRDAPDALRGLQKVMTDFPMFRVPMEVGLAVATADWAHKKSYAV